MSLIPVSVWSVSFTFALKKPRFISPIEMKEFAFCVNDFSTHVFPYVSGDVVPNRKALPVLLECDV